MKKEHEIDQLFKKGLEEPDIPFNELDWKKMADKLDAQKSRKDRSLWYAMAGIAALLLIVLSLFLFNNKIYTTNKKPINNTAKSKPAQNHGLSSKGGTTPDQEDKSGVLKNESNPQGLAAGKVLKPSGLQPGDKPDSPGPGSAITPMLQQPIKTDLPGFGDSDHQHDALALSLPKENHLKALADPTAAGKKITPERINGKPGKLTLSILAAPDITDTRSSIGTKVSSNFGLLLTYPLSKKLSVSSGAIYARKLYNYGGIAASAYGNSNTPWEVDADCYVIDVPLNLNYQVLQKKKFSVSVNTGLSSYFMLKEKYDYINVNSAGKQETTSYVIKNENKHILGLANFSISLDHKINDRVSIGVQPFVKVPLTGIGYYDTNLKSKGVAVSISLKPFGNKK